FLTGIGIITV
nr:Chain C, FLT Cognate peptide [synthetic construct]4GKS_F Chain F, FLT Cognate peptide [synthetic construct]